ncbi:molybdopterin synthase catalytic subunit MoaE [Paremcibacter congregatus]|uniref:Molybdopterin synthase catalytic subunit n=1 Tax=Paremcibacter congregatus TaxID=2043170 RepID=A0A2G4YN69_9PROT|nr:molybdopterin synthase catalytic subunit MoaE [Paremcibacter congregatus]PHZ83771.1 molybdopterin synthase catalytic subunit MoaE [Paremcibacter congregatus]QDE27473.1 molybdopterin synthase catalytic subunit MoaE [Paremcibacter congregatus]
MKVLVQSDDFDIAAEINELTQGRTDVGAVVSFTGLVRDFHGDQKINQMTLEHFPGMAEKQLKTICVQAGKRWPLQGGTVIHRYGPLYPGDQIVLVVILSAHREAAFEAAEFIMDWLKTDAPFWKKEQTSTGARWVNAKESDTEKSEKWLK